MTCIMGKFLQNIKKKLININFQNVPNESSFFILTCFENDLQI